MENRSQERRMRRQHHGMNRNQTRRRRLTKNRRVHRLMHMQDEQYLYVETRRPEQRPAVEEQVPPPLLIAPAPLQPPQPPAEPELPEPGERLRRSNRNRHPPCRFLHIIPCSVHGQASRHSLIIMHAYETYG